MDSVLGTKPSIEPNVIIESGAPIGEHMRSAESIEGDSGNPLSSPTCSSSSSQRVSLTKMAESSVSMPQSSSPTLPSEDACSSHEGASKTVNKSEKKSPREGKTSE